MAREEIYGRRSIRKFKEEMPPLEVINEIMDAGRVAPSGSNRQPWKFLVYAGERKSQLLAAMEAGVKRERRGDAKLSDYFEDARYGYYVNAASIRAMKSAPVVIVVLNPYGKSPFEHVTVQERVSEIIDTLSIGGAVENMLLCAQEMGVGSLWIGGSFWAYEELERFIGDCGQLTCIVALGYADEDPAPRPRKELKDIVEYYID